MYPARVIFISVNTIAKNPSVCLILDLQHYWSIFNILIRLGILFTSTNKKACEVAVEGPFILIKSTTDPDLCSKLVHVA